MHWVRSNRRFGSWLALAALALQIVLSFGHFHLDRIHRAAPFVSSQAQASQSPPAHPGNDADDYCAICATIYLASTSFVAQPPQLLLPFVFQSIEHLDRVAVIASSPRRTPFQSRAPPLA